VRGLPAGVLGRQSLRWRGVPDLPDWAWYVMFGGLAVLLLVFSFALWTISGRIVGWMHGAEKTVR